MGTHDFDVIIVGGGPAGSTAAAFARQRGLSVALVEKDAFPRFHIGESLLPNGNALLRESGVWPKIEGAGFIKKYGAYFFLAEGTAEKEVIFSQGLVPGLDYTYQVERAKFDALLLDHARELGAVVLTETTVRQVSETTAGCQVVVTGKVGGQREITSRWILDASGRENVFSSDLKRDLDPPRLTRRVAIYSHFRGVARAPGQAAGHTVVVRLPDGWFWLIPIDAERTSVGLVTSVEALREQKTAPEIIFQQVVASAPRLTQLMTGAEAVMPFHVTTDYSYFRRNLASERTVLVGDAGGFFDPIFSSGVYVAMYSAKRAVELIHRAQQENRVLTALEGKKYTRALKQHAGVFEKLIHAFYDNDSFAVFMSPRPPLRVDRGLNAIVAGHAQLKWRLWWRFHFFLFICRLQKRFQVAVPISFSEMKPVTTRSTISGTERKSPALSSAASARQQASKN